MKPAPAAYRAGKIGEGAQTMARTALDAVSAHLIDTREEANSGFWFQAHGDVVRREEGGSFTNFGFTRNVDLGYRQDGFGGQIGFDKSFGGARLGLTGGYESSVMNFRGAGDRVTLDAWSGGLYAAFAAGPLFVNAQGLYTRYSVEARLRSAGAEDRFNGHSWSGKLQAGLRLGGSGFFAEPVVGLSYVDTSLGALSALGARIDFTDSEGLFGEAGLRLGSAMNLAGGARLTLYASGSAVKSFEGTNRARFVTGATAIELGSDRLPTHGLGKLGVSIGQGRFTGFLEGRAVVADDYRGGGARMGLRIAF